MDGVSRTINPFSVAFVRCLIEADPSGVLLKGMCSAFSQAALRSAFGQAKVGGLSCGQDNLL